MKTAIKWTIGAFIASTVVVACGTKNNNELAAKTAAAGAANPPEKSNPLMSCKPSAAGIIYAGGELLKKNTDNALVLNDTAVSAIQTSGENSNANPKIAASVVNNIVSNLSSPSKESLDKLSTLASQTTYINIGCDTEKLPTEVSKNWTELKLADLAAKDDKSIVNAEAASIFVCGKQVLNLKLLSLVSNQMIFDDKDASISLADTAAGSLSILTNTLGLEGNNVVSVKTADGVSFSDTGATLSVNVINGLAAGSVNHLTLKSTGGNCAQVTEQKATPDTVQAQSTNNTTTDTEDKKTSNKAQADTKADTTTSTSTTANKQATAPTPDTKADTETVDAPTGN